jgi:gas vesicle protein
MHMSHSPYEPEGVGRAVDADPSTAYGVGTEVSPGTAYAETYVTPVEDLYAPLPQDGTSSTDSGTSASDVKDTAADQGRRVADTAKEQAGQVKDTAVEQGQKVASVAKDEAVQVKNEAASSLKDIVGQSRSELATQAGNSQNRLAEYVHSLADELGTLASKSDSSGPITDLAHRGARTGGELSHWLSEHEPADLLTEVTGFARRRPFAFLGASLLAGVVVGRVTRSLAAEKKDEHDAQQLADSTPTPALTGPDYAAPVSTPATTVGYGTTGYDQTAAVGDASTGGYASGYVASDLPESPAPQTWTGGAR